MSLTNRRVGRCPPLTSWFFVMLAAAAPRVARADDAACIAASEAEAGLQKAVKFRAALKELAVCADPSCPAVVRAECSLRIAQINAAMPTLILGATDGAGRDLVAVAVSIDGAPFVSFLDGRSLAIDPGRHVLRFEVSGKDPVERTVVVHEAEKERRVTVSFGPPEPSGSTPPGSANPSAGRASWTTRQTLAVPSAAVGIVGVGLGIGFGLAASSDWSAAKNECSATSCPGATRAHAEDSRSSAVTSGDVSTAAFVVGAVGLAGGVVLWLTAPKGEATPAPSAPGTPDIPATPGLTGNALHFAPTMGTHGAGLTMLGSFR